MNSNTYNNSNPLAFVRIEENINNSKLRDLDGVITISSAKPGNGVEQLRDNNLDSYWQSDGFAPHTINIQFPKRVSISKVCLYIDYNLDESYTPRKLSIRAGMTLHDLFDITTFELNEPSGWVVIDLNNSKFDDEYLLTHMIQVRIHSMHQNGRDSHIRQLKVLGINRSVIIDKENSNIDKSNFISQELFSLSSIR